MPALLPQFESPNRFRQRREGEAHNHENGTIDERDTHDDRTHGHVHAWHVQF
jgi:hypothetical protein